MSLHYRLALMSYLASGCVMTVTINVFSAYCYTEDSCDIENTLWLAGCRYGYILSIISVTLNVPGLLLALKI